MMCGHTTPEVEARWGDYGDMARNILQDTSDQTEEWWKYCVCDNQFPTDDEFQEFDGIVITGSKHDAFADDPWIVKLRSLMRREAERKQRILGLCFGAQLLAVALGGKAGNSLLNFKLRFKHKYKLKNQFLSSRKAALLDSTNYVTLNDFVAPAIVVESTDSLADQA